MKITRQETELLTEIITLNIEPEDYKENVEKLLKQINRSVQIPGFRPGHAPASLIRKNYYTYALGEELEKLLTNSISKFLAENHIDILGYPLAVEDVNKQNSLEKNESFTYAFEIGIRPEIDARLGSEIVLEYPYYEITEEKINQVIQDLLARHGSAVSSEQIIPGSIIHVTLDETDAEKNVNPNGWKRETYLFYDELDKQTQSLLSGLKAGDTAHFRMGELFPDKEKQQHYLGNNLPDDNTFIQISVKQINLWKKAELNQEFYKKVLPDKEISDEQQFREEVKRLLEQEYKSDELKLFILELQEKLVKHFNPLLPENFLRKWFKSEMEQKNKKVTDERFEDLFSAFLLDTRKDLIISALEKKYNIQYSKQELDEYIRKRIVDYFIRNNIPLLEEYIQQQLNKIKKNQNDLRVFMDELSYEKIAQLCLQHCTIERKPIASSNAEKNKNIAEQNVV
jgi:trigger factor